MDVTEMMHNKYHLKYPDYGINDIILFKTIIRLLAGGTSSLNQNIDEQDFLLEYFIWAFHVI